MRRTQRVAWSAAAFLVLAACGEDSAGPRRATPTAAEAPEEREAAAAPVAENAAGEAAPGTPLAGLAKGALLSDAWYEVREDGRKSGWYHMVWTRSEWDGEPSIHDHTIHYSVSTRRMAGIEDVFESETVTDLERTEDGLLLWLKSRTTIGDRLEVTETRWEAGAYVWKQWVAGREEVRRVASAAPLPVDSEAFLAPVIRKGGLAAGATHTYGSPNYLASRVENVTLAVGAKEDVATPAGRRSCWKVVERVEGRPGETTWWLDDRGVLTQLSQPPLRVVRTTEKAAKDLDPSDAAYSVTFDAEPELPRVTSLDRSVVDVVIRGGGDVPLPEFPATPFSKVLRTEGATIRMELTAHDDPAATVTLPVALPVSAAGTDPGIARALEATNLYAPDSDAVRSALRAALLRVPEDRRSDGRTVALALLRHVFAVLRKQSGPIPQPTAPEILESGMGDCSEHAVLFVALCRAAGLPARRLSGYAQVGDMWGAHSFCEVWLGKWIGADPTTNELGTRARYVAFGWDEDPDSYPGLVSQRVTGRMKIRTLEFADRGATMTVEEAKKRKPLRDDLAGLVFEEPGDGWTVELGRRGSAEVTGPELRASVHVSSGVGDLDASLLRETQFGAGRLTKFGTHEALRVSGGLLSSGTTTLAIPYRRRTLVVVVRTGRRAARQDELDELARLLEPTLRD